jgi:Polyketide cyclase / dehydrase and lipid transport
MNCSAERAFDFFADHRNVAQVLDGVSKWEPVGGRTRGVGALYAVEMTALGLPLRNLLRLNAWQRPRRIGWISEAGLIKQTGGFTFTETDGGVRVTLRIAYEPPMAFIGAAIAERLDGIVRRRLEGALERIRDRLEQ